MAVGDRIGRMLLLSLFYSCLRGERGARGGKKVEEPGEHEEHEELDELDEPGELEEHEEGRPVGVAQRGRPPRLATA